MPVNSYKDDEKTIEVGKLATLGRLFKYLLAYKSQIVRCRYPSESADHGVCGG